MITFKTPMQAKPKQPINSNGVTVTISQKEVTKPITLGCLVENGGKIGIVVCMLGGGLQLGRIKVCVLSNNDFTDHSKTYVEWNISGCSIWKGTIELTQS